MARFVRGQSILIEATIKDLAPFGSETLYTPNTSVKLTIVHVDSETTKVSDASMTEESAGELYYQWNTTEADEVGFYSVEVQGVDAAGNCSYRSEILELADLT